MRPRIIAIALLLAAISFGVSHANVTPSTREAGDGMWLFEQIDGVMFDTNEPSARVVDDVVGFNIVDLAHVVLACWGQGPEDPNHVWPELLFVWDNPNTPGPELDACSIACEGIWDSWLAVLELRGWTIAIEFPGDPPLDLNAAQYLFSFTFPRTAIFGTGGRRLDNVGLAWDETNQQMWMRNKGGFTPIDIPADPQLAAATYLDNPSACPVATVTPGLPRFIEADHLAPLSAPAKTFGDFAVMGGRFWAGYWEFYNVAGRDNLGISTVRVDGSLSSIRGAFRVGPVGVDSPVKKTFHANKTHQWILPIPKWYADAYLQGRRLGSGRARGAGAFGGAMGPALYAFYDDATRAPGSHLDGIPLIVYRGTAWKDPEGIGYRNSEGDQAACATSIWTQTEFAVVYGWKKGQGDHWYGCCHSCTINKGWQANPYRSMLYLYTGADIAKVAQGQLGPVQIQPAQSRVADFVWQSGENGFDPNCENGLDALAWIPSRRWLVMVQTRAYNTSPSSLALPVGHVLAFLGGSPPDTTGGGNGGGGGSDTTRIPLNDLGSGTYLGFEGGLWPDGSNTPPADHVAAMPAVQSPLLLSVGYSNVKHAFCDPGAGSVGPQRCAGYSFVGQAAGQTSVPLVNGAVGGTPIDDWDTQSDPVWNFVKNELGRLGHTESDVTLVYASHANVRPSISLPDKSADAFDILRRLGDHVRELGRRYRNLERVYLGTRTRSADWNTTKSPEPFAYETGLAVKWLIEAQIEQRRSGTVDAIAGDLISAAPWLTWATYGWATETPRDADGFFWTDADLAEDGAHASTSGRRKEGRLLLERFSLEDWW